MVHVLWREEQCNLNKLVAFIGWSIHLPSCSSLDGELDRLVAGASLCRPPGNSDLFLLVRFLVDGGGILRGPWLQESYFHRTSLRGLESTDPGRVQPSVQLCLLVLTLPCSLFGRVRISRLEITFCWNGKTLVYRLLACSFLCWYVEVQFLSRFLILGLWSAFLFCRTFQILFPPGVLTFGEFLLLFVLVLRTH